ncbi:unnamed protein product, partial [Iphiclides podalirius]
MFPRNVMTANHRKVDYVGEVCRAVGEMVAILINHCIARKCCGYRAGAIDGVRTFSGMATGGARTCSVFACTGDTIDTCGRRFPDYEANTTAVFEEISIEAVVPTPNTDNTLDAADSAFYPVSLDVSIMPLKSHQYTFDSVSNGSTTTYFLNLNSEVEDLYSFAVWGRVFATDGEDASPPLVELGDNSSSIQSFAIILLVPTIFCTFR